MQRYLGMAARFFTTKRTLQVSIHTPIRSLLEQLWQESLKNDAYTGIQLKSLLFSLPVQLGRFQDLKQEPQILAQAEAAIQESARFIYEHYQENLSLKDAATIAPMSPSYFSRKFKESTGFGFKEYLINIRMQEATHLLLSTAAPVTELAGICGFSDSNYFGDAFRKNLAFPRVNIAVSTTQKLFKANKKDPLPEELHLQFYWRSSLSSYMKPTITD